MISKAKIIYLSTEENMSIYLTEKQRSYFKIDNADSIIIKFASIELNLKLSKLTGITEDKNKLYLSKDLEDKLFIPNGTALQIKKSGSNELELGPLVGVFIDKESYENLSLGKPSVEHKLFTKTSEKLY